MAESIVEDEFVEGSSLGVGSPDGGGVGDGSGVGLGSGTAVTSTITSNVVGAAALPAASVALHVTVVVPTAKVEPEAGVHRATPAPSTSSAVSGGVYVTGVPDADVVCAFTAS